VTERVFQLERGAGFEGRRRGGGPHVNCTERQREGLTEHVQAMVRHYDGHENEVCIHLIGGRRSKK
jgi:hypothetical protein